MTRRLQMNRTGYFLRDTDMVLIHAYHNFGFSHKEMQVYGSVRDETDFFHTQQYGADD